MRMPFEKLMEYVGNLSPEQREKTLGELPEEINEEVGRITDAIDAVRVLNGESTYILALEESPWFVGGRGARD